MNSYNVKDFRDTGFEDTLEGGCGAVKGLQREHSEVWCSATRAAYQPQQHQPANADSATQRDGLQVPSCAISLHAIRTSQHFGQAEICKITI